MLGQPLSMLVPQVVGFKLSGSLPDGATATDLVLTVTEMLRKTGVVGKFVEYFGEGVAALSLADRATIGNMSPEYGATCGFFPVDQVTLDYLRLTGRDARTDRARRGVLQGEPAVARPDPPRDVLGDRRARPRHGRAVARRTTAAAGPRAAGAREDELPRHARVVRRRLRERLARPGRRRHVPRLRSDDGAAARGRARAGPRPQDTGGATAPAHRRTPVSGADYELDHGSVVIAAITSCTNTSNPQVMVAAGLLARNAVAKGLDRKPWVKSSLAPGSKVVTRYYEQAGLQEHLDSLGFNTVGYGCTTCIGNSGPLADEISGAIAEGDLVVCSVLSGNRNFEARIHPEVKANYLASPPLVVAYSLAGRMDIDFEHEPIGTGSGGEDVFLRDIWPSAGEVGDTIASSVRAEQFAETYADVFTGDDDMARTARAGGRAVRLGARTRRTCGSLRTSQGCRASRRRLGHRRERACSCGSETRSRPTTSRRPARSSSTRRPAST